MPIPLFFPLSDEPHKGQPKTKDQRILSSSARFYPVVLIGINTGAPSAPLRTAPPNSLKK